MSDMQHRDLPTAVADLAARVERLESMLPKTASASSPVAHENKGGDMGGLWTERVVLEITWKGPNNPPSVWDFDRMLMLGAGESVRVVPKAEAAPPDVCDQDGDRVCLDWRELANVLKGERDKARGMAATAERERDELRNRDVAGMEYKGNSVGYWHLKATAYKDTIGAIGDKLGRQGDETLVCAAERLAARVAAMQTERDDALEQVAELERAALQAEEQKAAAEPVANHSGKPDSSAEPVAWGVKPVQSMEVPPGCASPRRVDRNKLRLFPLKHHAEAAAERSGGTAIPLYAAPPPSPGWLTGEER